MKHDNGLAWDDFDETGKTSINSRRKGKKKNEFIFIFLSILWELRKDRN